MASSSFWTSSWGRVIRQLGIYAAGVIPFVGAVASLAVKYVDSQVFAVKTKKPAVAAAPPRPAPTPAAQARVIRAQDALFLTRQEADGDTLSGLPFFPDGEPPPVAGVTLPVPGTPGTNGTAPAPARTNDAAGGFRDLLQSVTGGATPSVGFYFALGAVVLFAVYLILSSRK